MSDSTVNSVEGMEDSAWLADGASASNTFRHENLNTVSLQVVLLSVTMLASGASNGYLFDTLLFHLSFTNTNIVCTVSNLNTLLKFQLRANLVILFPDAC